MSFYNLDGTPSEKLNAYSKKLVHFYCDHPSCQKSWTAQYRSRSKTGIDLCPHHRHLGHTHNFETRIKISEKVRGKKSPNYKDGTNSIRKSGTHNIYYREWRDRIRREAENKCEICGSRGSETHHSATPYRDIVKLVIEEYSEYDLENSDLGLKIGKYHIDQDITGMWLCPDCHRQIHKEERRQAA